MYDHITVSLDKNWRFRYAQKSRWLKAEVPGCVHTDLLQHKMIPDPFDRDNETKLQWIGEKDWIYETRFDVGSDLFNKRHLFIRFHGLDTYAKVTLNDAPILRADNMFRTWTADIKPHLKTRNNVLRIRFRSPLKEDSLKADAAPYSLPDSRGYTRKAPYHYGWDWGPRFITAGIWRPVTIFGWNLAVIEDFQMVQKSLMDDRADLEAVLEIRSEEAKPGKIRLILEEDPDSFQETPITLKPGLNQISLPLEIANPKRWWPNGLGEPYLYSIRAELAVDEYRIDQSGCRIGLRTVELVTEKDTVGESFFFKVNGTPVFMKGANIIPLESFLPRASEEKYKSIIQSAAGAHMNMLRVWGGGIYENDFFYDLCDESGIMIWQDFMFACNLYPGDPAFLENVRQEAVQNIRRLRNHPCIALWCGNNEVDEGWHNWGWKDRYTSTQANRVWSDYQKLFHEILPEAVRKYDTGCPYWPSSPKIGWGRPESIEEGDCHYWGVWWGREPFEIYKEKTGRFMSEYGFQGFPPVKTIHRFTLPEDRYWISPVLDVHQKHPYGFELIETYMKRDFSIPDNLEDIAYISQILQAEGIRTAIEAHRRAKPNCMGTLYWQLNDCWPVISWSSLDYYGRWKALHYAVKRAYQEVLVSPVLTDRKLGIFVVSDRLEPIRIALLIKLMTFDGKIIWEKSIQYIIPKNTSQMITGLDMQKRLKEADLNNIVLQTVVYENDQILSANQLFFVPPKERSLKKPEINTVFKNHQDGVLIELSSDILAQHVRLDYKDDTDCFSDNYFNLVPGVSAEICYSGPASLPQLSKQLNITSLADVN